jgi:hypothetical protein
MVSRLDSGNNRNAPCSCGILFRNRVCGIVRRIHRHASTLWFWTVRIVSEVGRRRRGLAWADGRVVFASQSLRSGRSLVVVAVHGGDHSISVRASRSAALVWCDPDYCAPGRGTGDTVSDRFYAILRVLRAPGLCDRCRHAALGTADRTMACAPTGVGHRLLSE